MQNENSLHFSTIQYDKLGKDHQEYDRRITMYFEQTNTNKNLPSQHVLFDAKPCRFIPDTFIWDLFYCISLHYIILHRITITLYITAD